MQMHSSASVTIDPRKTCDEELIDEADEPPDDARARFHTGSGSDGEFSKQPVLRSSTTESLLTRALCTSPHLRPVDRVPRISPPTRGMSTCSMWSNTSTAELTSDGQTTPSRASTPSPPPPLYLTGIASLLGTPKPKPHVPVGFAQVEVAASTTAKHDPSDCQERKRCITFAIGRRRSDGDGNMDSKLDPAPKKSGLTFVCGQSDDLRISPAICSSPVEQRGRSASASAATGGSTFVAFHSFTKTGSIGFYDSEGTGDSWTYAPYDRTRLLKVDDVLLKERNIRKLSEEAEAEEMEPDGDDDENDDGTDGYGTDDGEANSDVEDQEEAEAEEDEDDYSYMGESGNETDNEEGFGNDESDDELFFTHAHHQALPIATDVSRSIHPPQVHHDLSQLQCHQCTSDNSTDWRPRITPRRIQPSPPELPDSTDFVCGTLDEDKPLEQAYVSCLEERKRSRHKTTPQDIDPSFPTSDSEESEDEDEIDQRKPKTDLGCVRFPADGVAPKRHREGRRSPLLRGRVHSPAPIRRKAQPSSPVRRLDNCSPSSRPVSPSTIRGRAASPAPIHTASGRLKFDSSRGFPRTRSLPRAACSARRTCRSTKHHFTSTSPQKAATRPVLIRRGAMDIYKGLEKRRERRKVRMQRKDDWKAGEGVEKMRELGLEVWGKAKPRPAQWVISA